jgi:hypothetical protein
MFVPLLSHLNMWECGIILKMDSYLQAVSLVGDAEVFLMHRKDALQAALAKLLVKKKVKTAQDLVQLYQIPGVCVCGRTRLQLLISCLKV